VWKKRSNEQHNNNKTTTTTTRKQQNSETQITNNTQTKEEGEEDQQIIQRMADGKPEKTFDAKIVLLGNSGVGKTSLVYRYVHGIYQNEQPNTIGASFMTKRMSVLKKKERKDSDVILIFVFFVSGLLMTGRSSYKYGTPQGKKGMYILRNFTLDLQKMQGSAA